MHISVRRLTHLARWTTPALAAAGALAAALTDATADPIARLLLGAGVTAMAFTAPAQIKAERHTDGGRRLLRMPAAS